jgi:omega-amidase
MRVYCCQHDIQWEDRSANHRRVSGLLKDAPLEPGSLVLLPEMFASGFTFNVPLVAEGTEGATRAFLSEIAAERGVFMMGGIVSAGRNGRGRNEAVVFSPEGRELACYCKLQTFTPGGESAVYEAGSATVLFNWRGALVAPFICYDLRFPERQRVAAKKRPHLMTFIASWPDARLSHWVKLLQARAIENQCYVAGVNRIGSDPQFHYSGRSMIVNPMGEVIADAGTLECIIGAEIEISSVEEYRVRMPFLEDAT